MWEWRATLKHDYLGAYRSRFFGTFHWEHSGLDPRFLLLGILYGLFTLGAQSFYIIALKGYSLSVCALVYALNFLIPTMYGVLFEREYPSYFKIIGIVFIVLAVCLISFSKKDSQAKQNKGIYLVVAFLAMLCSGCLGIIQKIYGRYFRSEDLNVFILVGFTFVLLSVLILFLMLSRGHKRVALFPRNLSARFYLLAILLSISLMTVSKLNAVLASALPSFIFFPILNGGTVVASMLISLFVFKEKATKTLTFSGLLGVVGIVLVAF